MGDLIVILFLFQVNKKTLPNLPDCPVTKITQVNVQNVQCFFNFNGFELRNEAKLRINVTAGNIIGCQYFNPL